MNENIAKQVLGNYIFDSHYTSCTARLNAATYNIYDALIH